MLITRTTDWFKHEIASRLDEDTERVFTNDSCYGEPWPGGDIDPFGKLGIRWPVWDPASGRTLLVANVAEIVEAAEGVIRDDEWDDYLDALSVMQQCAVAISGGADRERLVTLVPTVDALMENDWAELHLLVARVMTMRNTR